MSNSKSSTTKEPRTRARKGHTAEEHRRQQAAAWEDLKDFLMGLDNHGVPDRASAESRIRYDLEQVLDQDLLTALKQVQQHYIYNPPLEEHHQSDLDQVWPVQNLINMLEHLRDSRLRVALDAFGPEARRN